MFIHDGEVSPIICRLWELRVEKKDWAKLRRFFLAQTRLKWRVTLFFHSRHFRLVSLSCKHFYLNHSSTNSMYVQEVKHQRVREEKCGNKQFLTCTSENLSSEAPSKHPLNKFTHETIRTSYICSNSSNYNDIIMMQEKEALVMMQNRNESANPLVNPLKVENIVSKNMSDVFLHWNGCVKALQRMLQGSKAQKYLKLDP